MGSSPTLGTIPPHGRDWPRQRAIGDRVAVPMGSRFGVGREGFDPAPLCAINDGGGTKGGAEMGRMAGACGLVLVGSAAMPAGAQAQTVSSFDQLARMVRPGDRVAVTFRDDTVAGGLPCDRHSDTLQGQLTDVSPTTLTVGRSVPWWRRQLGRPLSVMPTELEVGHVCLVQRIHHDSVLNGAVLGAIVNFAFLMSVRTSPGQESEVSNRGHFLFTSLGALAGVGVDILFQRGRETVYRAVDYDSASGVRVVPLVARGRYGLGMTLRF